MRKSKTLSSNIIRKPKQNQQLRLETFKDHNYTLFNLVKLSSMMACGISGGRNNVTNNQIVPFVYPMKPSLSLSLSLSHKIQVTVSLITSSFFVFVFYKESFVGHSHCFSLKSFRIQFYNILHILSYLFHGKILANCKIF